MSIDGLKNIKICTDSSLPLIKRIYLFLKSEKYYNIKIIPTKSDFKVSLWDQKLKNYN